MFDIESLPAPCRSVMLFSTLLSSARQEAGACVPRRRVIRARNSARESVLRAVRDRGCHTSPARRSSPPERSRGVTCPAATMVIVHPPHRRRAPTVQEEAGTGSSSSARGAMAAIRRGRRRCRRSGRCASLPPRRDPPRKAIGRRSARESAAFSCIWCQSFPCVMAPALRLLCHACL